MNQKERTIIAFFLAWSIFFLNLAGGYFSWYSGLWWYDMLMHFMGGMMIGTTALIFAFITKHFWFGTPKKPNYSRIILVIFLGIVFWEILEFSLSNIGGDEFYILDSISDMALGLSGALFVLSNSTIFSQKRV